MKTKFSDREELLLKALEDARSLQGAAEIKLEAARRNAQAREGALREESLKAHGDAAKRQRTLAFALARLEPPIAKAAEEERRRFAETEAAFERELLAGRMTETALRQSHRKAQAEAEERLRAFAAAFAGRVRALVAAFAAREAGLLEAAANERELREKSTLALEKARRDARAADQAFQESQNKSITKARAQAAKNAARQMESAKNTRSLIESLERQLRESQHEEKRLKALLEETTRALDAERKKTG
jgi:hypothetical protein